MGLELNSRLGCEWKEIDIHLNSRFDFVWINMGSALIVDYNW